MRYGVAGLRFVFGMRSGSGVEEKIEFGLCVGILIVFAVGRLVGRDVLMAHDMLKRLTYLVSTVDVAVAMDSARSKTRYQNLISKIRSWTSRLHHREARGAGSKRPP
jgi:hypothetical protein